MNRWSALAVLVIFAGALAFRLPKLDTRPLHNDEAVNAIKVAELWGQGRYKYDPDEYHGPTLHYATVPFLVLSGTRDANELPDKALRYATVFFGAGLIFAGSTCTCGLATVLSKMPWNRTGPGTPPQSTGQSCCTKSTCSDTGETR